MNKNSFMDRYYLDCRCMLLEIAATLDRYDRSPEEVDNRPVVDPRLARLHQAIEILAHPAKQPDRAERILLMMSEPVR